MIFSPLITLEGAGSTAGTAPQSSHSTFEVSPILQREASTALPPLWGSWSAGSAMQERDERHQETVDQVQQSNVHKKLTSAFAQHTLD